MCSDCCMGCLHSTRTKAFLFYSVNVEYSQNVCFIVTAGQIDSWIFDFNSQSTTEKLPGRDKRPATMTINIINGIPLFVPFFIFLDRFSFFLSCCIFHYPVRNQIDASTFDRFICRLLSRIAQAISRVVELYTAPRPRQQ